MAPAAIYTPPSSSSDLPKAASPVSAKGLALAIGSLTTAADGTYQSLVSDLQGTRQVERQMLDRLLDGAATLAPGSYASVHVALSQSEYGALQSRMSELLSQLLDGLTPLGTLHILNLTSSLLALPSELTLAGFNLLTTMPVEGTLIAQKPAHAPGAAFSLKTKSTAPAFALPRRNAASKKALWTLSAPNAGTIDADALLTDADRARPAACEPVTKGGPRRKKACKGCTCGLAEEEEAELRSSKVVLLDGSESGATKEVSLAEKDRLIQAARAAPKATSSCGSCFLGDAFRCASCPYMGLPAFNPGEKVEIDFGMDDI
ncbi:DUF689-domain-containing protein [Auriscalpium vulgare]|uniref:DUF689-domain-containing protein n=1 Tax=Auriscalpium vulgare TaxID=40419 RepID=A0ACB8S963_9AGAM|nr:DUF689-domain-containing protein [Auriscalpium vulgare]